MSPLPTIHVVEIIAIKPHPQSSKLKICLVQSVNQTFSVVCGANNTKLHMKTLLAPIGQFLPHSQKQILSQSIKDVISEGMLCSAKDLQLSQETGLVDLPQHTEIGKPWDQLPIEWISSIPWYQYQLIESWFWNPQRRQMTVVRDGGNRKEKEKMVSQTYFDGTKYLYRHFKMVSRSSNTGNGTIS
jgi:tRNA-binding EMAP/Myf-like protein